MTRIAYPFLTLGPDAVDPTVWELIDGGGQLLPLQKYIEDWDYLSSLRLRRRLSINLEIASNHLAIPEAELDLTVLLRIGTGPGTMPRAWVRSVSFDVIASGGIVEIDEFLVGDQLSGRIKLETSILSFSQSAHAGSLSPRILGAKVWNHDLDVTLEGTEPRFPMETISFETTFAGRPHASSLWYLHWSPGSIHSDFGGAVRLYVNSDRKDFIERLTENDPLLLQTIMADVMTQLVSGVISMDEAQEVIDNSEDGSIAGYVGNWLKLAFPGESAIDVRSKMERRPSDFNAGIQAAAEIGGLGA
ncbi:hypothetical protein SuNHUV7_20330 (plasmid) [Pseudoseohaeicola sp. NH-UV-7]|uniref:hypothetical protein n=1 Tax=Sulfitobacter sp. TBRI5 TaxID=2989732 RepID=UPI003A6736F8